MFGGSFNPIHKGHELIALKFYEKFKLDKLIIMPANVAPHKIDDEINQEKFKINAENRLEMCKICFDKYNNYDDYFNNYCIEISNYEIKKSGVSYSYDTLNYLRKIYEFEKFDVYFLIGSDMFLYLEKWYKYKEILNLCEFVVAVRSENNEENVNKMNEMQKKIKFLGYDVKFLENKAFEISSTQIRNNILNGINCDDYLDKNVLNYINVNNLY